jgi:hypothetical protein
MMNKHYEYHEVFDKKFDLQSLYPTREKFHISEVLDFYSVLGIYFAREYKFYLAKQCLKILVSLHRDSDLVHQLDDELCKQLQMYQANQ